MRFRALPRSQIAPSAICFFNQVKRSLHLFRDCVFWRVRLNILGCCLIWSCNR